MRASTCLIPLLAGVALTACTSIPLEIQRARDADREQRPSYAIESAAADTTVDATVHHYGDARPVVYRKKGRWDEFPRPITNLNFNDPFVDRTQVRTVYMNHEFPHDSVFTGGRVEVWAVQAWLQLTDDIQFVADKDGWIDLNADAIPDEDGWADVALGFKHRLHETEDYLITGGLIFETKSGDKQVFQGTGDGMFDVFVAGATEHKDVHLIWNAGLEVPMDRWEESTAVHAHLHADKEVAPGVFPMAEVNLYHYIRDGHRDLGVGAPLNFEGGDLTNLGSSNVDGNTVVTGALGVRWQYCENVSFGAAWERPISTRKDFNKNRITLDVVFDF